MYINITDSETGTTKVARHNWSTIWKKRTVWHLGREEK